MTPSFSLAARLLTKARVDLCISDADPDSRGVVIHPDELPRLGCHFAPMRSRRDVRIEAGSDGWERDSSLVYRPCVGMVRGHDLGDADVLELVQHMLDLGRAIPEWATRGRVSSEVYCLLLERGQACCEVHRDRTHRPAYVGRMWLANYGSSAVGATTA